MISTQYPVAAKKMSGAREKRTFAKRVFPHPGGPASNTPAGALRPRALNCSGLRTGAYGHKHTLV